ncbi:hypothetical protein PDESU_05794 [Pontiella desulfatans]|uniref:Uncharacterized protein n=1 Tax=Pontiella desulfatans TaxID=2750659 RepID=A0A6C2UAQ6_PONDE|nr:DUF4209 domain-containing protein [Pontiella desulfatans]VGO17198.1 hypothetical protein PDESU_05794 [Pontiella desulfatans]
MSDQRYPEDLIVTADDFQSSGWEAAIDGAEDYMDYWQKLSQVAREAIEAGESAKGKVLWLIADACAMDFNASSIHNPFVSRCGISVEIATAIPEIFTAEDVSFFNGVIPQVDDCFIKARLADVLWLIEIPKNPANAFTAIEAYQQFPLDQDSLVRDSESAWERAIRLCYLLRRGSEAHLETIRETLFSKLQELTYEGRYQALWIAQLLGLACVEVEQSIVVCNKLESIATTAKNQNDWNCTRSYIKHSREWHTNFDRIEESRALTVEIAESWAEEGAARSAEFIAVGHCYENAIHEYRTLPNRFRRENNIVDRLTELRRLLNEANANAVEDMQATMIPGCDISESIESARQFVEGREFPDVIRAFVNIFQGADATAIRATAERNMGRYVLSSLFGSTHLTHDGRVRARSPGIDISDVASANTQLELRASMVQNYNLHIDLVMQGAIIPAFHIIQEEHRFTEYLMRSLCSSSSAVPKDRVSLWAKGLLFGFEEDFAAATHLLVPQVEHLVRVIFKENEIITTRLDPVSGIETENGLGTLLDNPRAAEVLGDNIAFELKVLLTDEFGANLRNQIAHGLFNDGAAASTFSVYAWWYCLKLVINSIPWPDRMREEDAAEGGDATEQE